MLRAVEAWELEPGDKVVVQRTVVRVRSYYPPGGNMHSQRSEVVFSDGGKETYPANDEVLAITKAE